ncbi:MULTISPECIES: MFS transporter [unclassified Streptomyces]|uniref:MFS transporter n=1 Tax=unclassified Streptomyces TaxID=2593676 RepID=UPI0006FB3061|nr:MULTISPECIES: MFS transporter [unclassified Streptomyces]KQX54481.1 MFS transporter [Streptomyces sp. Root1304]KRA93558.1 MFS transporter [Streptomyces sp. Root66D1]
MNAPDARPTAPATPEPARAAASDRRSLFRLMPMLTVANAAMYMVYMGIGAVLLPIQVELVDPADKVANFGLVSGVSAIFATLFNPLAGLLSDRSGRRNPWILGGGLAALGALALLGAARTVLLVTIGWCLVQAMMNIYQAALTAVVPDRVPVERRGLASAMVGIGTPIGSAVGISVAALFVPHDVPMGYLVMGAVIAGAAVLFTAIVREERRPVAPPEPLRGQLAAFARTLRSHDFRWVFIGRFLMMLGFFSVSLFQLYILQDHIKLPPGTSPTEAVAFIAPIDAVCTLLATILGGLLSDRIGRRKPMVLLSSALAGVAMLVPVVKPDWTGMLIFTVISGLAFGCYMAVDTALVTLVLPSADDAARDMGVLNIANAGPQILAPFMASLLVGSVGYDGLYITAAAITMLGAASVIPIKKVR